MWLKNRFVASALAVVLSAQTAFAAISPIYFENTLEISDFKGKTYATFMSAPNGVKAGLDAIATKGFAVADARAISKALKSVDSKVYNKAVRSMEANDLGELADYLAKKEDSYLPATFYTSVRSGLSALHLQGDMFDLATFLELASGAGVAVKIDADNYYYNVGYGTGKGEKDLQTGRSFGDAPKHRANDASDIFYLNELEQYLTKTRDTSDFYRALFDILTACDTSSYSAMSDLGQTVATDFVAVYTAEADRHMMVKLSPKTAVWEWDLAATTMAALFSARTGLVMKDGALVKAPMKDWWKMNPDTGRSGIGKTARDRKILTKMITAYERKNNASLVNAIEKIVGKSDDVIQTTVEFLSNTKTPKSLGAKASALTEAVVAFMAQVGEDAKDIAASAR